MVGLISRKPLRRRLDSSRHLQFSTLETDLIRQIRRADEEDRNWSHSCHNINDLELSVRAVNCLSSAQIHYLGELVEKTESQMLKYRNFGKKSLLEIKEKLNDYGLGLEMVLKENVKEELMRQIAQQLQTNNEE